MSPAPTFTPPAVPAARTLPANSGALLRPGRFPIREGNCVELLVNGCDIFPAMLSAIREAEHSICLETYIYWDDNIGQEFAEALADRARAGLDVRLVLDWVGCNVLSDKWVEGMEQAGVKVSFFRPLRWYSLHRLNNRTHRKLLVVDGHLGFIGGVGIADPWCGHAQDKEHWRDNHYRLRGPVVADLLRVFFTHWDHDDLPSPSDEKFFPALDPCGNVRARMVAAEPEDGPDRIHTAFLDAIAGAQTQIGIITPYFMPCEELFDALRAARRRGVQVEVLTCGEKTDQAAVRHASRHRWGELLDAGIRIDEYESTLLHCKALMVDHHSVLVGSANFDCRSCRINDEANLLIEDEALTREHWKLFETDRQNAHRIQWSHWKRRSLKQKLIDGFAHLFRDQL